MRTTSLWVPGLSAFVLAIAPVSCGEDVDVSSAASAGAGGDGGSGGVGGTGQGGAVQSAASGAESGAGGSGGAGGNGGEGGSVSQFPCGAKTCLLGVEYCLTSAGGPKGPEGPAQTSCEPLPPSCEAPDATCACFVDCPCLGASGGSCEGTGIATSCEEGPSGELNYLCAYP